VDQADRLRAVYGVDGRPKKWWRRLFWGILDMAFVNSYVIFSDIREKMSLLEYRRSVAMGLKKRVFNQNLIQNGLLAKYHFTATLPKIVSWNFTKCNFRLINFNYYFALIKCCNFATEKYFQMIDGT
jgi:hypothetical protein